MGLTGRIGSITAARRAARLGGDALRVIADVTQPMGEALRERRREIGEQETMP